MFGREPTVIIGFVRAVVVCAVAFGLELTPEQIAGVYLVVEALLTMLNRAKVTPIGKHVAHENYPS